MSIVIERAGLQATIQAGPRNGQRHLGMPASGAADPLSMALANRLVGNSACTPLIEATLTGITVRVTNDISVAVTGAVAACQLNGESVEQHETLQLRKNDVLDVGAAKLGVRSYIAFSGGLIADDVLGSRSTYLPAAIGGHQGRALQEGNEISLHDAGFVSLPSKTPDELRLPMVSAWTVRADLSCESALVDDAEMIFDNKFQISNRSDRMGIKLEGHRLQVQSDGQMPSVPVFPGVIQCPPDGESYILSIDSGTTGGYPRIAKIARMDLHVLGQLRPGNSVTLIRRDPTLAATELREKHAYWQRWLPDVASVI